jgi:hypothetical protein
MRRIPILILLSLLVSLPVWGQAASFQTTVTNGAGQPLVGVSASVCQGLATTAASLTANVVTLTMTSNPLTAGFTPGSQIAVYNFTGADSLFNSTLSNGTLTTYTVLTVTSTQLTYALIHNPATATSNGFVVQQGTSSCLPLATTYTDATGSNTIVTQSYKTDGRGNFGFFGAPGPFIIQYSGSSALTSLFEVNLACVPANVSTGCASNLSLSVPNTWTALQTFNAGMASTTGSFSGALTVNGVLNANGNTSSGNVPLKYASASAYRYVDGAGSDSNDGLSPGTAYATPQHCNTVVVALGGGTCDARTLYSFTYGNTLGPILVGQHSPQVPVSLLLPPFGTWHCQLTGGTNSCLETFAFSSTIGPMAGQGNQFFILADSTANVIDVCGTDPSPLAGATYIKMVGFGCESASGSTVSGAVAEIQQLFDTNDISDISTGALAGTSGQKALWVHNVCCSTKLTRLKGEGSNATNNVPCYFGPGNSAITFDNPSCTDPGAGKNAVVIDEASTNNGANRFWNIYTEITPTSSDNTTAAMALINATGNAPAISGFSIGVDTAGSTRYAIDISNVSSANLRDISCSASNSNAINDHNTGKGTLACSGNDGLIRDYTSNQYVTQPSYLSGLQTTGVINGTGLQIFNTTTTCSTSGVIDNTCTTAAIMLPVAEPDTNYRVVCTGKGPTNVPVVAWTTNLNAIQFTITIASLTAAVATFASYDCTVGHN